MRFPKPDGKKEWLLLFLQLSQSLDSLPGDTTIEISLVRNVAHLTSWDVHQVRWNLACYQGMVSTVRVVVQDGRYGPGRSIAPVVILSPVVEYLSDVLGEVASLPEGLWQSYYLRHLLPKMCWQVPDAKC